MLRGGPIANLFVALALVAGAVAALLNPGNFGTIDTEVRLRVARWIRLGEPLNAGEFGVPGRNGMLHPHFGIGQSLFLMQWLLRPARSFWHTCCSGFSSSALWRAPRAQ